MYVYLHILSFKFVAKVRIGRGVEVEEDAEAGKTGSEKGKTRPE
jgi:hypothetical protein